MTSGATRRMFLSGSASLLGLGLSGCIPDVMAVGPAGRASVTPPGYDPDLLAVTTRRAVKGGLKSPWFGPERAEQATAVRVVFNRPDTGLVAQAQSAFFGAWTIKSVTPEPGPAAEVVTAEVGRREVLLYVHGYKESFESAVAGGIELAEGIGFSGKRMAFSWPSKAALLDYGYDRESALISRDALEELLITLLGEGGASRLYIVAHSMGTLLTIEALRQLWARHGDVYGARLGAVVLASPDIDFDLFDNAMRRLRSLSDKITVISSTSDRALEVSRRIAGGVPRVGGASREQLEGLGVKVVDASDYGGWTMVKHDLFLSDSDVRAVVRRAIERGRG
ncbi:MAG: alpha/beta hydrolase [Methylocystis sp.]|nr:alpha/beta hydrolase [Methylocystis sp.]MCA3585496.1 alpha/beta hydrolase [Methylocystis sp.]MCA3588780.1 alpha/beta hydrolase [Methylocystis sp.]MCA3591434.1 alpha/beta hydrolase [Methylocystis sp.]